MKSSELSLALGALIACSGMLPGMAAAASGALSAVTPKVLPVLVQVNAHGKVTGASPATELSPKLSRLLRANLDEMIVSPALDKQGRATSSQFVINLALHTSDRPDGDFDVTFAYVSTSPVPAGSWYWVHTDGRQLALASQSARNNIDNMPRRHDLPDPWRGQNRFPMPGIGNTGTPAPAAIPAASRAPAPGSGS